MTGSNDRHMINRHPCERWYQMLRRVSARAKSVAATSRIRHLMRDCGDSFIQGPPRLLRSSMPPSWKPIRLASAW